MTAPPVVGRVLASIGQPLAPAVRADMEGRFGRDFSDVRVHADAVAAESAQAVAATAYAAGRDLVFGSSRYRPETAEGRGLLAHELAHVVQQRGLPIPPGPMEVAPRDDPAEAHAEEASAAIQAGGAPTVFPSAVPFGVHRQAEGTTQLTEHVSTTSTNVNRPGVWSGGVTREERTAAGRLIHQGLAPIQYDENTCSVTVPMTVAFRHATLADVRTCPPSLDEPPPTALPGQVDGSTFRRIATEYVRNLNEDLNGWYGVRFTGCPTNRCHNRQMTIQVHVSEVSPGSQADYEVALANMEGRSCVDDTNYRQGRTGMVLLYAQGLGRGTMAHEGGHMILGHGDEYRETEAPSPDRPAERVREGDWSRMGEHSRFGRFSLLHRRHFAFVPAFLNDVRPGCAAGLVELTRPTQADVTIEFGSGFASFGGAGGRTSALYMGAGIAGGLPLSRERQWEVLLGLHFRWLAELEPPRREAFLLGARLGLEHTFRPSAGGFTTGMFGEIGAARVLPTRLYSPGESARTSAYAEGGAYLGYTTSPLSAGLRGFVRAEGAAGTELSTTGTIGSPGAVPTDPDRLNYYRLGLSAGLRF